jgi:prepilin-type processing-associated H-X9-DG protein
MGRRVGFGVLALIAVFAAGMLVTWLMRSRAAQDQIYCVNNLREISQFAYLYADAQRRKEPAPLVAAVPAGTVFHPELPPERRLSWVPPSLLFFNQRRQDTTELVTKIDSMRPWDEGSNAEAGRVRLLTLLCPANPHEPPPDQPAVTLYVGLAGLGRDAATLDLGPPIPPRAGCFRYDSPTPLELISRHDGLSQTLMFAETSVDLGPWIQGGPATVRGVDDSVEGRPYIGTGGQFGGNHVGGANFALADGSVRFLTQRIDPDVFKAMATIAGGPMEAVIK